MNHLVNPNEHAILDNAGDRVPWGLFSIAANNTGTKVYDLNHMSWDTYMAHFEADKPETVGISVYTSPIVPEAKRMARELMGKTELVAGGYHATVMPETLPEFDRVVQGPGEYAFTGQDRPFDIATLNPALPDMSNYNMQMDGKRTATLLTSRGCPYSCSFCGKMDKKVQNVPILDVLKQIDHIRGEGFEGIYFLDDVFSIDDERMFEITARTELPFRMTTRANLIHNDQLAYLRDFGLEWISLGIESGDDNILRRANKGMTKADNLRAVTDAGYYGVKSKGFFIIGLPGETEKSARKTIEFAEELRQKGMASADFYYLTPFPGTPIWNNPDKFGITIRDRDYTKYLEAGRGAHCVVDTEELKAERLEELVQEARSRWS